jgi:hypothetical protein
MEDVPIPKPEGETHTLIDETEQQLSKEEVEGTVQDQEDVPKTEEKWI